MHTGEKLLKFRPVWRALAPAAEEISLPAQMGDISLRNPIGLAAGLDKKCEYLSSLADFGFGYVVGGTVTYNPRPGNSKPRVIRNKHSRSLINALGFPGDGLTNAITRLSELEHRPSKVLVSIAALDDEEAVTCLEGLEPLVDAVELNISSPNTLGIRKYHDLEALKILLGKLNQSRNKPIYVKLPPFVDGQGAELILSLAQVCKDSGISGFTVANTIPVEDSRLAVGRGGLSGREIFPNLLKMIPIVRSEVGDKMVINACGGISSGLDAHAALQAGADTVQLYTALVFEGPKLVSDICNDMRKQGLN
jgi:dihydroorotate dehydrogenase